MPNTSRTTSQRSMPASILSDPEDMGRKKIRTMIRLSLEKVESVRIFYSNHLYSETHVNKSPCLFPVTKGDIPSTRGVPVGSYQ